MSENTKTVAVMQPYFLPYIGYFQLIAAVDKFIVLDDVNYIKKGWVNRNNIIGQDGPSMFTIPLTGASQNKKINELMVSDEGAWQDKFWRRIVMTYSKSPYFRQVGPIIEYSLRKVGLTISEYNLSMMTEVLVHLGVRTAIEPSTSVYQNDALRGQDRILDFCTEEAATRYINPIGGKSLYDKEAFKAHGINLHFLRTRPIAYAQGKHTFVPNLSILDVMMWNPPGQITEWLGEYDLE